MIDFNGIQYAAVIVTAFINIIAGAIWYSPIGFQKRWSKLSGVNMMKIPKDEANRAIMLVAAAAFAQSYVLAVVLHTMRIDGALNGLLAGIVLWFGLTALTTLGNTLYSRLSLSFWWLNASFFLIVMSINSVILAVWK